MPIIEPFVHCCSFPLLTGLLEGRPHISFKYNTKYSAGKQTPKPWGVEVLPPQTLGGVGSLHQEWLQTIGGSPATKVHHAISSVVKLQSHLHLTDVLWFSVSPTTTALNALGFEKS